MSALYECSDAQLTWGVPARGEWRPPGEVPEPVTPQEIPAAQPDAPSELPPVEAPPGPSEVPPPPPREE